MNNLDQFSVNVIKGLILDAIAQAKSGHPGGAMSSADFVYVLFKDFLKFDPMDPNWFDRDRFVLSPGHESALLYSILVLLGYLPLSELKRFRQLKSKTPGHPEVGLTPGVEATTGPLGQGLSMAVGMAVAERFLGAKLGKNICDHYTYVLASDGDMQEPVVLGSASLAGRWNLGKLIVFYDKNQVQLAGPTSRADLTDYQQLFASFNWQVIEVDGHDHKAITEALLQAQGENNRPSLIIGHTVMAKGCATLEGSEKTHGAPLSFEELKATKQKLGLPEDQSFYLPKEVVDHFRTRFSKLKAKVETWKNNFANLPQEQKDLCNSITQKTHYSFRWPEFEQSKPMATRKAFGICLDYLGKHLPNLMGGSADLDPSNQTVNFREQVGLFNGVKNPQGRYLAFGVREFPMGAILNGLALHGGIIPFGATFLVFSDYERSALRMSALQNLPVLHVFTHDSFYVGEDGPTHQPVEHISSLRLIPNFLVFRPADANETKYCLELALTQTKRPSALILSRQTLPLLNHRLDRDEVAKGGYVVLDSQEVPELIIIATGSEVHLALAVAQELEVPTRVISMVCPQLFLEQSQAYRNSVLLPEVEKKVAIEAGKTDFWYRFVGLNGLVIGMDQFGASAPAKDLEVEYGFTPKQVLAKIKTHFNL